MESSPPRKRGDNAVLSSQIIPVAPYCFKFWYYMYGSNVGSLNISQVFSGNPPTKTLVWSTSGDQGPRWKSGNVSMSNAYADFYVSLFLVAVLQMIFYRTPDSHHLSFHRVQSVIFCMSEHLSSLNICTENSETILIQEERGGVNFMALSHIYLMDAIGWDKQLRRKLLNTSIFLM